MDLKGSLADTKLKIIPSKILVDFINSLSVETLVPVNISKLASIKFKGTLKYKDEDKDRVNIKFNNDEINILNKISYLTKATASLDDEVSDSKEPSLNKKSDSNKKTSSEKKNDEQSDKSSLNDESYLETFDIEWLYSYIEQERNIKKNNIPFLHELLEGSKIIVPENKVIKRNPDLEARCVTLRAQQEAREYRKMTKTVDNVRMRYPEESISYQLKHLNRQLIAIGQFIISIFAGFLFGFRGVEWMVGNLDFGFRLLLGVMCALIIALAEIYFLAKKLNEEYSIPETVQLGGPTKFANQMNTSASKNGINLKEKEHDD